MDIDPYILDIPRPVLPSLPPPPLDYEGVTGDIIIDNGATSFRWGFTGQEPSAAPTVIAKYKDRRNNKPLLLFGDAVDCETGARGQARTPWEGDVLLNFDALVYLSLHILSFSVFHSKLSGKHPRLCLFANGNQHPQYRPPHLHD